jgi:aminoglycoside phosphotransferase
VLLTVYRLASQEAKNKRLMDNTARKLREDHALRMTMVEIDEEEQLNLAEIQAYREAVASGRLTAADALAARRAKKTLKQLEAEQKRDLNGDGIIEQLAPLGFSDNHKSKSNFQ